MPWPCGSREAPQTHSLGKKTVLWSLGCWTDGWGHQTEVADVTADTKGPGIPGLAHRQTCPHRLMYSACTLRVTVYSLDVLLSLFGTSLLLHVQF